MQEKGYCRWLLMTVKAGTPVEAPDDVTVPRRQRNPEGPTPEMVDAHSCSGHAVFASWCIDCCRGRAQEWKHQCVDRQEDSIPTILWDYAYLGSQSEGVCTPDEEKAEEAKGSSPMIVAWDSCLKRYWAHIVDSKGVDFHGLDSFLSLLVDDLKTTGYKKVIFRSDGEPALLALLRAVIQRSDLEVIPQISASGYYKSHGAVENAVKLAKVHTRTFKSALERRLGIQLEPDHPVISW